MKTLREKESKKKKKKRKSILRETFSMYDNDNDETAFASLSLVSLGLVDLQQGLLFFCSLPRLFFLFSASEEVEALDGESIEASYPCLSFCITNLSILPKAITSPFGNFLCLKINFSLLILHQPRPLSKSDLGI